MIYENNWYGSDNKGPITGINANGKAIKTTIKPISKYPAINRV
jgi:hypothetical protein